MEQLKKSRSAYRANLTKVVTKLEQLSQAEVLDITSIRFNLTLLDERYASLRRLDETIYEHLLNDDGTEEELENELTSAGDYFMKYEKVKIDVEKFFQASGPLSVVQSRMETAQSGEFRGERKRFKLPKIEFVRFNGDIKEWLIFWGQFKKIDEDKEMSDDDKFQYLLLATVPHSRAREVVESFPLCGEHYKSAISSLKDRFGREDLLIEYYIRDLLKLVLQNSTGQQTLSLGSLYDKLKSHLRALETMWGDASKCRPMLYPMVESCLPEEMLRAWQRAPKIGQITHKERLDELMKFLLSEVEAEDKITLAMSGFGISDSHNSKNNQIGTLPTSASLVSTRNLDKRSNTVENKKCVFCTKTHRSAECFLAQKMSLDAKKKILIDNKRCFTCMGSAHIASKCKVMVRCIVCGKKHLTLMCPDVPANRSDEAGKKVVVKKDLNSPNTSTSCASVSEVPEVFLQTILVRIKGINKSKIVRALIDTGSQRSYLLSEIISELGLIPSTQEEISHALFGGFKTDKVRLSGYRVNITNLEQSFQCNIDVLEQGVICQSVTPVVHGPWNMELARCDIKLTDIGHKPTSIGLLIGADVAGKLFTGKRKVLDCGLVAMETLLGWTLMGKIDKFSYTGVTAVLSSLNNDVRVSDLWDLDLIGIKDPVEKKSKEEVEIATKNHFLRTIVQKEDGRYEVCFPWNYDSPPLPKNRFLAERRLKATTSKLLKDNMFEEYENVLLEWLNMGIIEEAPAGASKVEHYLPHRAVIKLGSSTPIRPVFDASAKERNQPSLNQCLDNGPNLIELIPEILLRFRQHEIGIVADIKKAFLMISIRPEDRDVVRFLWWENQKTGKIKIYRHCRVVFGVKCSPFLLGATIEFHVKKYLGDHMTEYSDWVIRKLLDCFYVDNTVTSVVSKEALKIFHEQSVKLMSEGCFELRQWEASTGKYFEREKPDKTSVLGIGWHKKLDELSVNLDWVKKTNFKSAIVTKKLILSCAHKIFDPIGVLSPVVLKVKALLQKTWTEDKNWEAEVSESVKNDFIEWTTDLVLLEEVRVKRWIGYTEGSDISIHVFCDASQLAYATCIFFRVESGNSVTVNLVGAKARLAPMKGLTIPRLELLAALIGTRLCCTVKKALNLTQVKVIYYTDSSTVLSWINKQEQWGVFVFNRVKEIRMLSEGGEWRLIGTKLNPADLPSRGCSGKHLIKSKWWEGPDWLKGPSDTWPKHEETGWEPVIENELEYVSLVVTKKKSDWYYKHSLNFNKIVKLVAWVKRFISNCRFTKETRSYSCLLSVKELEDSERAIIKMVQEESFKGVKDPTIRELNPYVDNEGLIRLKSKVALREDNHNFRYPLVLPKNHAIVDSLIRQVHISGCHQGVQMLLCALREHYWILGGRKTIKKAIKGCIPCRRYGSKSLKPVPAALPSDRVQDSSVFEVTGIDFAGPLYLKGGSKAWIALFTCAVYRAVHLELVPGLSTEVFLLAFRRFIARRGRPRIVYSDNGTNFVGANNAFKAVDWETVAKESGDKRIQWVFNPPTASWWGGWWERLIGLVKNLLLRSLGRASLTADEISTVLCECEAVINARPLTYISSDREDLAPISPDSFLHGPRSNQTTDFEQIDAKNLNRRLRHRNNVIGQIKQRFRSEYLGQLVHRGREVPSDQVKVGELYYIGSDGKKRVEWPLGRVISILPELMGKFAWYA